jgi:hypothetical protein
MAKKHIAVTRGNRLLAAIQPASRERLTPYFEEVDVELGQIVCEAGGILNHAYFPNGAVLSLLTVLENGSAIETANIGREGAFGLFAAMYSRTSFNRSLVQLRGGLIRVPIKVLQVEFENSRKFAISSSAIPKRSSLRFSRRLRAIPCTQRKRGFAGGSS